MNVNLRRQMGGTSLAGNRSHVSESSQIILEQRVAVTKTRALSFLARWQPAPLIHATLAIHAVSCVALAFEPAWWGWAFGAVAANHSLIGLAVAFPRSRWLGTNLTRLPPAAVAAKRSPSPSMTVRTRT